MYGYVQVYRPDLRFREYEVYRSHYCGLCHALQQRCNAISRLTLSYDFTFLSLLLDALYEPEADTHKQRCFCGIGKNATVYHSAILDYVADMHLFFAYLHCKDDWNDEHSIPHAMLAAGIKTAVSATLIRKKHLPSWNICSSLQHWSSNTKHNLLCQLLALEEHWQKVSV